MKRKNNIFFSAFVLIATFAFMLSPLGVYAASDSIRLTESETTDAKCVSDGGKVTTNFYMFLEGSWVVNGELSDAEQTTQMRASLEGYPNKFETGKSFSLGKGSKANEIISAGKVAISKTSTGENTSTESWSLEAFYNKAKEGGTSVKTGTVRNNSDKTIYWATDVKWTKQNGQTSTENIDINYSVDVLKNATYPSDATFDIEGATLQPAYTGTFNITRPIDVDAIMAAVTPAQAVAAGGHVFNPQVYYVKYCAYPEATPTSDGFKVEYDPNGGTSAPDKQDSPDGSPVNISDGKPNRNGYTFLGWSTDPKATEPDSRYAAGKSYAGPNDLYLYAVWSPKTGVSDYLMATAIVAGVAGLGLFISRRKRLFKQI